MISDNRCSTCGESHNEHGILIARGEVIPFVKVELLKLRYPTHPFPLRFGTLTSTCFSYGQLLSYKRKHDGEHLFLTEDKTFLKYADMIFNQFGIEAKHPSEIDKIHGEVCEFGYKIY